MPLFEFLCMQCGEMSEALVTSSDDQVTCQACGSKKLKRMLSAPSTLSGVSKSRVPGPGDTSCCGSSPSTAGCAGPGSCCGKMH
ncbi:MAG: FmdB family transcriptional regulator [Deltaproteobacteria bacterium HGW-Deltaproteobacteria-15]|jgi:putative FmdB family regulatory protein|nr:MAG: FmdB family transcriptional regulator [Deltaproteobacteria bacterium HGW-Deltaproteobacteria-15]